MPSLLPASTLKALTGYDTCAVSNAIESFDLRLRNEGYCDSTVHCRFPLLGPLVGYAVTLRIRSGHPPLVGGSYAQQTDWWDKLDLLSEPRIVVIQDMDHQAGAGSFVGEVHAAILQSLGCIGVVTNGAVRDLPGVERTRFQMFSGNVSLSHAYVHVVDAGSPVVVGGLTIHNGDLLHGDCHGLLRVPLRIAAEIPAVIARCSAHEQEIIAFCRSPQFTREGLRKLVQARG